MTFLAELWSFLRAGRKISMMPMLIVMILLGGPLILAKGSAVAPSSIRCSSASDGTHPRNFRLLPRQCRCPGRRWRDRNGCPGRAIRAARARPALSRQRDPPLSRRGRYRARRDRSHRLLRKALPEVRAPARNLSRLCAARLPFVPHRAAGVAEREAVPEAPADRRAGRDRRQGRVGRQAAVHRAPPEPRRERLLPLALRRGAGPDDGRRRRTGDHLGLHRPRRHARSAEGITVPAFARAALLGLHLLHRLQGQLGRVQGDGTRPVWRAPLRGRHHGPDRRREA